MTFHYHVWKVSIGVGVQNLLYNNLQNECLLDMRHENCRGFYKTSVEKSIYDEWRFFMKCSSSMLPKLCSAKILEEQYCKYGVVNCKYCRVILSS